jgi:integrase/recombinase XerD
LRALRSFGNWCEKEGYIDGFDCPIKEEQPPIKQVYTEEELRKLTVKPPMPFDKNFNDWRTYLIISLVLNTGARTNTLRHLRISELELDTGYINFNFTKAHQVVRLKLDRKLLVDFRNWINWLYSIGSEENDYMFPNEYGEQMARSTITKAMATYCHRRGVEKTSLHLLRHTFAKIWITSGGDIITLAKVLTHSELDMVKRYANLYGTDIAKELTEHSAIAQMKTRSGQTLRTRNRNIE